MQATGREPSMEEILASIKKVIAEDKDARSADAAVAQPFQDKEQ
jgi:cell pole-organizing protein PopZ